MLLRTMIPMRTRKRVVKLLGQLVVDIRPDQQVEKILLQMHLTVRILQ